MAKPDQGTKQGNTEAPDLSLRGGTMRGMTMAKAKPKIRWERYAGSGVTFDHLRAA